AEQLVDRGALEPAEALRVGERVAHVLATLHARKLIHRDVKPANVLLDDGGGVWLVDLGLTGSPQTALPGAGTPAYAAPEQLAGDAVAPNADVFALGRVLIETLTGKRAHISDVQPLELRELLGRMLAERAEDRPADGAVVAAALARIRTIGDLAGSALSWRTRGVLDGVSFLGRDSELARLAQQLASQRHAWISGSPGIGKAALVLAWWDRYAPIDATLAWADTAAKRSPLGLALRWVEAAAGLRGGERPEVRTRALAEFARALGHDAIAREVRAGSALDEAQMQTLLEATAAVRLLVLVSDDGRRTDSQSIALLRKLEGRVPGRVVAIHLDDEPHPDSALPPLANEAMRRIAEHAPEGAAIDHAIATASGNPLALQFLLLEGGNGLDDAIARRIQRLDPYARWLLRLGSLAGLGFRAATLLGVAGACDGPALRDGLGRLAEARLLVDLTREVGAEAGSYRFRHPLFARVARSAWSANRQALGRRLLQA
ncbi:MAG TPA: protein kinase, partial [Polyangiaceae bacterium]|nr:protein kinase [Polyangiaceae bacterium]